MRASDACHHNGHNIMNTRYGCTHAWPLIQIKAATIKGELGPFMTRCALSQCVKKSLNCYAIFPELRRCYSLGTNTIKCSAWWLLLSIILGSDSKSNKQTLVFTSLPPTSWHLIPSTFPPPRDECFTSSVTMLNPDPVIRGRYPRAISTALFSRSPLECWQLDLPDTVCKCMTFDRGVL